MEETRRVGFQKLKDQEPHEKNDIVREQVLDWRGGKTGPG